METDIDTSKVTIRVRCAKCNTIEVATILAESLPEYRRLDDGTYIFEDVPECAKCYGRG